MSDKDKEANEAGYCCYLFWEDIDTYDDWKYCPHCGGELSKWKKHDV